MTAINLREFSGMAPLIQPNNLAESLAVSAVNTRFDRTGLVPWNAMHLTHTGSSGNYLKSLYLYQNSWIISTNRRQYAKHPSPNDVHDRIYYTDGASYPKMRSADAEYRIGLPRPEAPVASLTAAGDISSPVNIRDQTYVVALVDAFGIEGPPSLPSNTVEVGLGFTVTLNLVDSTVSGAYNLGVGSYFRLYRTNNTTSGEAIYQYLGDIAYGSTDFVDTIPASQLEEALQSANWIAPPDGLASLVVCPGEFFAGHVGRTVYFSEPGIPSAWPYSYTIDEDIVGLVYIQGGLFVCTTGNPTLFTGSHPSVMAEVPIESFESCVAAASIVDMGEYAIYASPRGLVLAQGNTATLITTGLFDSAQWADYAPADIVAFNYRGKYLACFGDEVGQVFVFDPSGGTNSFVRMGISPFTAGYLDTASGNLSLVVHSSSTAYSIQGFDQSSTALTGTWLSKPFDMNDLEGFSTMRVQASTYPVSITVYADGENKGTFAIADSKPIRLPGGYRARFWQFGLSFTGPLILLSVASSLGELE